MNENLTEDEKLAAKLLGQNLDLSTAAFPFTVFRENLIRYLMKNVNGRLLFKLMKLNKWFIPKNFKFECFNDKFIGEKYSFSSYLWIIDKLEIYKLQDIPLFFQKLLYCNLKNVRLNNVILKFNDYKQLTVSDEYVVKVKEICPYEHIRTWYGERIENRPYPCLYRNDRGGQ